MAERIRKEDRDYKKRFLNGFKILTRSRNMYEVWSDAMYLFATGIANPSILTLRELKPFDDVWTMRRLFHGQDILGREVRKKDER